MRPGAAPVRCRIVLIGGGHAHVTVLKAFGMAPEPGTDIVLIARELDTPYSGMLPGYVAGHYSLDECQIDLVRLARFAGARLIHGEAIGIDRSKKRVAIAGRPPIAYDLVSFDTGITPFIDDIAGAREHAIPVKPVSEFAPRWQALASRALKPNGPRQITVIGTGAAGFELILGIRHRLLAEASTHGIDPAAFSFTLIGSGQLLPTHNARARRLGEMALTEARIVLVAGETAVAVAPGEVRLASGRTIPSDAVLVTTKAAPPAWFASTGLPLDGRGFLAVRPTLQVLDDDDVFAVGDCASVIEHPREKAGVFAVRQGPPLTENLRLRARGSAARPFAPQRLFLTLLSCGGKAAIAARGPVATAGALMWRWKDYIDRAFMRKFQVLPPMGPAGVADEAMLCAGCAAKLGPSSLAAALDRLGPPIESHTVKDLANRDDAALLDLGPGPLRLETVDHFPAIWPEPYVLGEIAAAHALGDVLAKGGRPDHALAVASLPLSAPHLAEDDLFQLLAGARSVLDREGVALVGGHTGRSETLTAGFFVSGTVERTGMLRKGGLAPGDVLLVTKPIGTGLVFAGWMRGLSRARHVSAALDAMRTTSSTAACILVAHGATAATDITGFGLGGHLLEMLDASRAGATIGVDACPRLPGADELIAAGVRSSLLADNMVRVARMRLDDGLGETALALLLDPQTSGGLLASIPAARAVACLAALRSMGVQAAAVGVVTPVAPGEEPVLIVQRHWSLDDQPPASHPLAATAPLTTQ
ncbi:MAG: selenide, water dikinase SelD [Hyphomicrobiaceae bacterium]|nr:selenide, water dikinase SelD [Hyphomicrobiaceae bacterium]